MEAERVFSACTDYAPVPAGLFESLSTQGPRECRQRDWCRESARKTEKLNALALPALLYQHPTGVYVLLFISSGTRLDQKCVFFFLYHLRGLACMERCQMLDLEEGQYISQYYLV
ncbi:hypothetical protein J6590_079159 [Homalodisca vitripennis]|nr:hypothetical protein J6590_079159 [Homalodisca vitripennis]